MVFLREKICSFFEVIIHMKIYSIRRTFILSQVVVFAIAISYTYFISNAYNYTFVLLYSLWNIISYGYLFVLELKYAPDFNPYQLLCLSCMLFTGLNGIDIYSDLVNGKSITFGVFSIEEVIHLGILFLSVQHIILFAVFFALEKRFYNSNKTESLLKNIVESRTNYYNKAFIVYGIVWVIRAVSLIIPLSSIGSILVFFANRGYLITLFLLVFERLKNPSNKAAIYIHWIIVAIEIVLVLGHGMKEEIIISIVPYCIYWILSYKAGRRKVNIESLIPIGLITLFVLGFVFPYISVFRSLSQERGQRWSDVSVSEVLEEYALYVRREGIYAYDDSERGVGYLMYRAGSIGCNAWSIDYAQTYGPTPEFAKYCAVAVVPRILWPQKPQVVTGGMISSLAWGDESWLRPKQANEYGNSMSLGFIGACYFSFGLAGALLMVLIHAFFLWFLWAFCRNRLHYNLFAIIIFINYIILILKDFEAFQDCGISFMATNLAFMAIAFLLDRGYYKI